MKEDNIKDRDARERNQDIEDLNVPLQNYSNGEDPETIFD